ECPPTRAPRTSGPRGSSPPGASSSSYRETGTAPPGPRAGDTTEPPPPPAPAAPAPTPAPGPAWRTIAGAGGGTGDRPCLPSRIGGQSEGDRQGWAPDGTPRPRDWSIASRGPRRTAMSESYPSPCPPLPEHDP